jgi:hypothetical protein
MWVYNSSHIHWEQVQTDPTAFPMSEYGAVIDEAWIVQHTHGPFDLSKAPQGHAVSLKEENPRDRQIDHWWPLLHLEDGSARRTEEIIQEFRTKPGGEKAWVDKLEYLRRWAHVAILGEGSGDLAGLHKRLVWEDVREDGSSDGAVFTWKEGHSA